MKIKLVAHSEHRNANITSQTGWRNHHLSLLPSALGCGLMVALLCLLLQPVSFGASVTPRPPNVIFFLIDDWGWTDAGCCGSKFYDTPNIDRLALEGMRFTQGYAACTVCSPTRAAIMTGKYPARLHITDWIAGHNRPYAKLRIPDWLMHLPLEEKTIAEALKERGYITGHFGKWHLGDAAYWPEHQGFDVNFAGCQMGSPSSYFPPYGIPNVTDQRPGEFLSDRITGEVIKFIEANREKPFFAYVPHYAVHTPLQGKPDVIQKYRNKPVTSGTHSNAVYAALVESVDDSVGAVLKKLAELKLDQNTVIFLTGDNGGLSGTLGPQGWRRPLSTDNSPLRWGKGSVYEGGTRVPLIVKWPGVTRPGSLNDVAPVISVDYFATILDLIGAPPGAAAHTDGESIVSLLKGGTQLKRDTIYWHYPHYHPGSATPYSAIRQGDFKLIEFFEDNHVELYNLKSDIGEKTDLAGTMPNKARELRAKLDAWRKAVGAQLPTPNPNYDPAKDMAPSAKKTERKAKKKAANSDGD